MHLAGWFWVFLYMTGISITDSFGESYCSVSWERAIVSPIPFQENKHKAENSLCVSL